MTIRILTGNCLDVMATMKPGSVDACVTDPPYHLTDGKKGGTGETSLNLDSPAGRSRISTGGGFMGQQWDGGDVAFRPETWAAVFRVLKPGAWLLAFGGTRTQHRMVCAIEDAGFEIRDQIGWAYGSGFPKSLDVSKAIDKAAGAERAVMGLKPNHRPRGKQDTHNEGWRRPWRDDPDAVERTYMATAPATPEAAAWQGWGTAIKPAWEPICVARKPLARGLTVAANVLAHGTGALNIDGCRIEGVKPNMAPIDSAARNNPILQTRSASCDGTMSEVGRWPANLIHDGSDEVLACFPDVGGGEYSKSGTRNVKGESRAFGAFDQKVKNAPDNYGDTGSAARFFYTAKASRSERGDGTDHPTVKPVKLIRWLIRLVTPPGGMVLDPFAGSGTTGIAANIEQMHATLIEMSPEYAAMAAKRVRAEGGLFAEVAAE